jgi:phosphohistidine phosphatase
MKTLLILRHAKSSWQDLGQADHDRPLNGRGKRDAPRMGKLMRERDMIPDLIISSTAMRARTTAQAVADEVDYPKEITQTRDLYHAYPDAFIEILQGLDNHFRSVLMVAHNPGIEELVAQLSGVYEQMTTGALAHFELSINDWQDLEDGMRGRLLGIYRPKELSD